MNRNIFIHIFILLLFSTLTFAQQGTLRGRILNDSEPVPGAWIAITPHDKVQLSDEQGHFQFEGLPSGFYQLKVSSIGFRSVLKSIHITAHETTIEEIQLEEDPLQLEQVVVSATRTELPRYNAPVAIRTISPKLYEATQAVSVAEGLHFTPGLRFENNCSNCGFTQIRMNGLEGAYTQLLINSRPVFSALAGVYGLEILPANMIERIEVVRGGGSVLYGGNAIAGTVNIITKEPSSNQIQASLNQGVIRGECSDRTLSVNASLLQTDDNAGISLFAYNRDRDPFDANGDGLSELTKLKNSTIGMDAFKYVGKRQKLHANLWHANEFRRGGNGFDRAPHQSALAEQLRHKIWNTNLAWEGYSKDFKHKYSVYSATQWVNRHSYYGAGGRIIQPGDSLTEQDLLALNAYGRSNDLSNVTGLQYACDIRTSVQLIAGSELHINRVVDNMPGYNRHIHQRVTTSGNYLQLQWLPWPGLTLSGGGRFDRVAIRGAYRFDKDVFHVEKILPVAVPRVAAMYQISNGLRFRLLMARGYRAPQAFNEDLHVQTVGGAARFINLSTNLRPEKSMSYSASVSNSRQMSFGQWEWLVEGFSTQLRQPFILAVSQELPNGVAVLTKRNGTGATVQGFNMENNVAFHKKWILQTGFTFQIARYEKPELIWAPPSPGFNEPAPLYTQRLLRTPDLYGFYALSWKVNQKFEVNLSGTYTGRMWVPHVIDPVNEQTIIRHTKDFFDQSIKLRYRISFSGTYTMELFSGIQNLFDSFQRDFDVGLMRDASYSYGPLRPRTFFGGLKVLFE